MYPFALVVALLGLLGGCTVQPTPREYIDRQLPVDQAREQAEAELADRVSRLVRALQSGDAEAAELALAPAPEAVVIGPGEGEHFVGIAQIRAILALVADADVAGIQLVELDVEATSRATAAWFAARIDLRAPAADPPLVLRVTGVYVQREGAWELRQAHFSAPGGLLTSSRPPAQAPARAADG